MVTRVSVAPELLRWAVERAGWDAEAVSSRAPELEKWVSGGHPTLKQLEKFANATHTPLGLFFLPEPPEERIPIPDMRTMGNNEVTRPSVDLLDTIYLCQNRQEWYGGYAIAHGFAPLPFVGSMTTSAPPETAADSIRSALRFGVPDRSGFGSTEETRRRLVDRIEDIGVLVMISGIVGGNTRRVLRPEEFRGFALTDPLAPLIFINGSDTKAAQIFTMVHELAHVWLGESALSDAAMAAPQGDETELWCNRVAAEVLVPLSSLRDDYGGRPTTEELDRLARRYRVSTLVVLRQIFAARLLTWEEFEQHYSEESDRIDAILASHRDGALGGNYYYTQPLRLSRSFARAVVASTFEGSTGYREAYRLLGTRKNKTFRNLAAELGVA